MKPVPVAPSKPVDGGHVVYAANQPEYQPLPAWVRDNPGRVVTRWRLTWRERLTAILRGDLYLEQMTFGASLQPIYPTWSEADMFGWDARTGPEEVEV